MTKEHLREYRAICNELRNLDDERLTWTARAEHCTRAPSQAPVFGGEHDPMPMIVDRLTDLREEAARLAHRLHETRARIERAIEKLPADQRRLMRARYIEGKDWLTIGREMSYSEGYLYKLHQKALISMKFIHSRGRNRENIRSYSVR